MQEKKSPWKKVFSSRLKASLKGHKQGEIATQIGVGQPALSGYANDKLVPSLDNFRSLCVSLGVKSDYLLGLDEEPAIAVKAEGKKVDYRAILAEKEAKRQLKRAKIAAIHAPKAPRDPSLPPPSIRVIVDGHEITSGDYPPQPDISQLLSIISSQQTIIDRLSAAVKPTSSKEPNNPIKEEA